MTLALFINVLIIIIIIIIINTDNALTPYLGYLGVGKLHPFHGRKNMSFDPTTAVCGFRQSILDFDLSECVVTD